MSTGGGIPIGGIYATVDLQSGDAASQMERLQAEAAALAKLMEVLDRSFEDNSLSIADYGKFSRGLQADLDAVKAKIADTAQALQAQKTQFGANTETIAKGSSRANYQLLQMANLMDDLQYLGEMGFRPIINNVVQFNPLLGMALIGLELMRKHLDQIGLSMGPKRILTALEEMEERVKELNKQKIRTAVDSFELDRLNKDIEKAQAGIAALQRVGAMRSEAEVERGRAVENTLEEAPGGAASVKDRLLASRIKKANDESLTIKENTEIQKEAIAKRARYEGFSKSAAAFGDAEGANQAMVMAAEQGAIAEAAATKITDTMRKIEKDEMAALGTLFDDALKGKRLAIDKFNDELRNVGFGDVAETIDQNVNLAGSGFSSQAELEAAGKKNARQYAAEQRKKRLAAGEKADDDARKLTQYNETDAERLNREAANKFRPAFEKRGRSFLRNARRQGASEEDAQARLIDQIAPTLKGKVPVGDEREIARKIVLQIDTKQDAADAGRLFRRPGGAPIGPATAGRRPGADAANRAAQAVQAGRAAAGVEKAKEAQSDADRLAAGLSKAFGGNKFLGAIAQNVAKIADDGVAAKMGP